MAANEADHSATVLPLLRQDPGFALLLLGVYAALGQKDAHEHLTLHGLASALGDDTIRTISTIALLQSQSSSRFHHPSRGNQKACLKRAFIARSLAQLTGYPEPEAAYLAGLIADFSIRSSVPGIKPENYLRQWMPHTNLANALTAMDTPSGVRNNEDPLSAILHSTCALVSGSELAGRNGWLLDGVADSDLIELLVKQGEDYADAIIESREPFFSGPSGSDYPGLDSHKPVKPWVHELAFLQITADHLETHPAGHKDAIKTVLFLISGSACHVLMKVSENGKTLHNADSDAESLRSMSLQRITGQSAISAAIQRRSSAVSGHADEAGAAVERQYLDQLNCDQFLCLPCTREGRVSALLVVPFRPERSGLSETAWLRLADLLNYPQAKDAFDSPTRLTSPSYDSEQQNTGIRKVAHEINNALGITRNYLKISTLKLGQDSPATQDLAVVDEELDRIEKLVRQLRGGDQGSGQPSGALVVNQLVRRLLKISRDTLLDNASIQVDLDLDEDMKPIVSNEDALKQVLINLIKNAAEAMSEGGCLVLSTLDDVMVGGLRHVEITVSDSGPGISETVSDRLLKEPASTKGGDHSGLGLLIVRNLVDELGGTLELHSNPKRGTRIRMLFPGKPTRSGKLPSTPNDANTSRKPILAAVPGAKDQGK